MEDIETLLCALRGENLDARVNAAIMLGRTGDTRAVEPLIALLQDYWMDVREAAARALGEIRDARAIGPLCSILSAYSYGRAAAEALVKIGAPAVEQVALVLAAKPDIIKARETAAEVLGLIGDTRAIGPLISALESPVGFVGHPIEDALVRIGAPAVEPLATALRRKVSDHPYVCYSIAEVLVRIGTIPAIQALENALKDEQEDVCSAAALTLANVGSKLAVEALIAQLKSTSTYRRRDALESLGKIDDVRVIEPLLTALRDEDPEVKKASEDAVMKMSVHKAAVKPLVALLRDTNQKIRYVATTALCNADSSAVEALIAALDDSDVNVRKGAVRALGVIGGTRGIEPLRAALSDKDVWVRKEAEAALKKLVR